MNNKDKLYTENDYVAPSVRYRELSGPLKLAVIISYVIGTVWLSVFIMGGLLAFMQT